MKTATVTIITPSVIEMDGKYFELTLIEKEYVKSDCSICEHVFDEEDSETCNEYILGENPPMLCKNFIQVLTTPK
jgi:hypothetical protein